jgi:hypothetical protein
MLVLGPQLKELSRKVHKVFCNAFASAILMFRGLGYATLMSIKRSVASPYLLIKFKLTSPYYKVNSIVCDLHGVIFREV